MASKKAKQKKAKRRLVGTRWGLVDRDTGELSATGSPLPKSRRLARKWRNDFERVAKIELYEVIEQR